MAQARDPDAMRPFKRRALDISRGADLLEGEIPVGLLEKLNKMQSKAKNYTPLQYSTVKMLFESAQDVQYLNGVLLLSTTGNDNARAQIEEYKAKLQGRDNAVPCEWYREYIGNTDLYVNLFFSNNDANPVTNYMRKFILNVAKRRAVDVLLTQASLPATDVNLSYLNYRDDVMKTMRQLGLYGIDDTEPEIAIHSNLQTLINDVAMDIVFRTRNECVQYPRGEALQKLVEDLNMDPEFKPVEYTSSELYHTLTDIYGYDRPADALEDYSSDAEMGGTQLRPTATPISGLQLRLRLT